MGPQTEIVLAGSRESGRGMAGCQSQEGTGQGRGPVRGACRLLTPKDWVPQTAPGQAGQGPECALLWEIRHGSGGRWKGKEQQWLVIRELLFQDHGALPG